jgi:GNAT superfamily N-acetyltransferase
MKPIASSAIMASRRRQSCHCTCRGRSGPLSRPIRSPACCWDSSRHQNWIGKGIGTGLLKHTLQRCVTAAGLIGGRALIVNAIDVEAAAFWRRRGFIPSKDDPLILFRSIADIAASLR